MAVEKGRRVLVVDNLADTADSFARLLNLWGYDVEVVYEGDKVVEAADRFQPHAVLLDIGMPGMDGFRVARGLRERPELRRSVIVGITGYGDEDYRAQAKESGFDYYLLKPVDLDLLQELLAQRTSPSRFLKVPGLNGEAPLRKRVRLRGFNSASNLRQRESNRTDEC